MSSLPKTFWFTVEVALEHSIAPDPNDPDDAGAAVGYIQNFGVTASTESEACELVAEAIHDGAILWAESRISQDVIDRLDQTILEMGSDWSKKGIWYKSGRALFPAD